MLVLSRKLSDTIKIGDEIEVAVLAIEGDQVKIGINAPKTVDIHRGEVYKAIQAENCAAASTKIDITKLIDTNK